MDSVDLSVCVCMPDSVCAVKFLSVGVSVFGI